jgi:hypothetical protein
MESMLRTHHKSIFYYLIPISHILHRSDLSPLASVALHSPHLPRFASTFFHDGTPKHPNAAIASSVLQQVSKGNSLSSAHILAMISSQWGIHAVEWIWAKTPWLRSLRWHEEVPPVSSHLPALLRYKLIHGVCNAFGYPPVRPMVQFLYIACRRCICVSSVYCRPARLIRSRLLLSHRLHLRFLSLICATQYLNF